MDLVNIVGFLWKAIWVVVSFGIIIFVHELGHFILAKLIGVNVERFSLGFMGKVVGFKRGGTEYQISWLPLGGYVKLEGEFPEKDEDYKKLGPRAFIKRPWWQRVLVYFAGPFFNYLGAIALSVFILLAGVKYFPMAVKVTPGSPAALSGVLDEDRILAVGGEEILSPGQLSFELDQALQRGAKEVPLLIERQGEEFELLVAPRRQVEQRQMIGVEAGPQDLTVKVRSEWPAAEAGMQDGDVILAVGSTEVKTIQELSDAIGRQAVAGNGEIQLTLKRDGEEQQLMMRPRSVEQEHYTIGVTELELPSVVGDTVIGLAAHQAGVRQGNRILAVDGQQVKEFGELARIINAHPGETLSFLIESKGERYPVELMVDDINGVGMVGIRPYQGEYRIKSFGLWSALTGGVRQVNFTVGQIARGLSSLFRGEQDLRRSIGGPITILRMMGKEAKSGWRDLLGMVIMLNVMLAMLNLLPIPVVDGGEIVMAIAEGILRRPLRVRTIMLLKQVGFGFILLLMVLATTNDIYKWFTSIFQTQIP
jgi:regulator of sigma E protease